jgi:general stress protein 26
VTPRELVEYMGRHKYAVQASVTATGDPQAAVIGIAVTEDGALVFDTLEATRKCQNLRQHPRVALVIGTEGPATVQLEGTVDEPTGAELDRLKRVYFERFPDGREREAWPGITYFRVRPTWVRHSDFSGPNPVIEHFTAADLATAAVSARQ